MGTSGGATIRTLTKQLEEARALVNSQAEQIKTLTERITQLENELAKAKKRIGILFSGHKSDGTRSKW